MGVLVSTCVSHLTFLCLLGGQQRLLAQSPSLSFWGDLGGQLGQQREKQTQGVCVAGPPHVQAKVCVLIQHYTHRYTHTDTLILEHTCAHSRTCTHPAYPHHHMYTPQCTHTHSSAHSLSCVYPTVHSYTLTPHILNPSHIYSRTWTHSYRHKHIHSLTYTPHTRTHSYLHSHTCTCTYTSAHSCVHTLTHSLTYTFPHMRALSCVHAHIHLYSDIHVYT